MKKLIRKLGLWLLTEDDRTNLELGRRTTEWAKQMRSYDCEKCDHTKHKGKCGQHLEYEILSEKDICQCIN